MTWSIKDFRQQPRADHPAPPPEPMAFNDDAPLPTYIADMPDSDEEELLAPSPQVEQALAKEGYLTTRQLDFWSRLQRRGIEARQDDTSTTPVPVRRSAHELPLGRRP